MDTFTLQHHIVFLEQDNPSPPTIEYNAPSSPPPPPPGARSSPITSPQNPIR